MELINLEIWVVILSGSVVSWLIFIWDIRRRGDITGEILIVSFISAMCSWFGVCVSLVGILFEYLLGREWGKVIIFKKFKKKK